MVGSAGEEEPFTAVFVNQSSGAITAVLWDFGDGLSSTEENPTHTYASAGTYTVTLYVYGSGGESSFQAVISVDESSVLLIATPTPAADVTGVPEITEEPDGTSEVSG
jgi:PKD repeat protein